MKKLILLLSSVGIICACFSEKNDIEIIKNDVWNTIKTINHLWAITENIDSLNLFIHDDMILISPEKMLFGKNEIIKSYKENADYTETLSLTEREPIIKLYNDNKTVVVSYYCDLTVKTLDGKLRSFCCKDMYTLVFERGKWVAVAQHYSFY